MLNQVCREGFTFGKVSGTGFGLYHAKKFMEAWKGQLDIQSKVGQGTSIFLRLRRTSPAKWFVPALSLSPSSSVVILDDNPAIHQLWKQRFAGARPQSERSVRHFSSVETLQSWFEEYSHDCKHTLFLMDFDLQCESDGLDAISKLGVAERSILVTSYSRNSDVRRRCERMGVQLLPKGSIGHIPIECPYSEQAASNSRAYDAILVDDASLIRRLWESSAAKRKISILTFSSAAEFYSRTKDIPKSTTIYIDSDLGHGIRGECEAEKIHRE